MLLDFLVGLGKVIRYLLLLFVVAMESLSRMLNATMLQGLLTGFSVGTRDNEELVVNHLLFVDDTFIFCGAQAEHVQI
jgi:hypothetical protein